MIYVGLPFGSNFGWGVLGKEVVLAMSQLSDIRLLSPPNVQQQLTDEFDQFQMRRLMARSQKNWRLEGSTWVLDGPMIQAAFGRGLDPFVPQIKPPAHVGFAVFEEDVLPQSSIDRAREQYRHLATGSSYCADVLRKHGLTEVSAVLHGVDTALFHPAPEPRPFLQDKFVIFSGGKFELRKGQDIVIRAYKVLQDRHQDVVLVNSWYNIWPFARETMGNSKLIRYFPPANNDYVAWMNGLLSANGIDLERVITVGLRDNRLLPRLYHSTDLGLFPNRVEGGTNMVLMEYMACGKPVLVSYNSGHKDVVRRENAVLIEQHKPMEVRNGAELIATWNDPSLEETVEKLEWCYQNRDEMKRLGHQAAADMREFPWKRVAEGLLAAVRKVEGISNG
jgi:glycosyltransferase involved in cell wall biosynthesis